jgi:uncharacterized protein YceK
MKIIHILIIGIALFILNGCAVISTRVYHEEAYPKQRYYPALVTAVDEYNWLSSGAVPGRIILFPFFIVNVVVSVSFDTLFIPFDAVRTMKVD